MPALRHPIRDHPVESCGGERQRCASKDRQQPEIEPSRSDRSGQVLLHRADVGSRRLPVNRLDFAAHGILQRQWINRRAQQPVLIIRQPDYAIFMSLMYGEVDMRRWLAVQAEVFDVSDHAHDLDRSRALIVIIYAQMRAEWAA